MLKTSEINSLQQSKPLIDEHLDKFLSTEIKRSKLVDRSYTRLLTEIKDYLCSGGKRIRPHIVIATAQGYGLDVSEDVLSVACAWELIHSAMLMHDDIIDRDLVRHGQPNIAGRYQEIYGPTGVTDMEHYASSAALLSGDLLISYSQQIILESNLASDIKIQLLKYINQAIFEVVGGEFIDTETALYSIQKTDARKIARYKTASYTFIMPLLTGAALAGAGHQEQARLREIGNNLGIAFQLTDDILGIFGDMEVTGKTTDGDIREKKHTMLVQEAYNRLEGVEKDKLAKFYSSDFILSDGDIETVRQLLVSSGAKQAVLDESEALTKQAESLIAQLQITEEARQELHGLVESLLNRRS